MNTGPGTAHAKIIATLCLLVLACILIAGLWPFHAPHNAVSWLKNENGLHFGRHGSAVSASAFHSTRPPDDTGSSLEIWLTPVRTTGGGCILAFDSSPDSRAPFLLRQYGTSIAVHRYLVEEDGNVTQLWFKVDHVFDAGQRVLLTITSGQSNTKLYVNGVLAGTSSDAGIVSRELTGRLVLANSTVDDSWMGDISGLAVYRRELDPAEVVEHLQSWVLDHGSSLTSERSLVALYRLDEHAGSNVRNLVDATTSLTIPAKYFVLHPAFMHSTWDPHAPVRSVWTQWSSWGDLAVNVFGFVPVGFAFFAYFSSVKRIGRPALVVVLLGFFLSFTIEALQRLLPNRDSGVTDMFTNTTGTALGVLLHQFSTVRALWEKALNLAVPASEDRGHAAAKP